MVALAAEEEKVSNIQKANIEEDERTPGLDTMSIAEFVKQRRRDALRITELTLRAIEKLENPNNNIKPYRESSTINSG